MTTTLKNTAPFDPRSISGCALWLDAADSRTITLSGSSVTQWRDKSGSGNHMNQYSAATAPSTSNLNGLPTVYFFTSDPNSVQGTPPFTNVQVLQGTNFQTTTNSTMFLVVYPLYVATSTKFLVNLKSRAANAWNNLYDINMGTGDGTNAGGFGSFIRTDTSYVGADASYYTINQINLTSSEIVGTSVAFYKDASVYKSGTVSLAMPASDNFQTFTLGAYLNTDVYDTTSKMGSRAHFCEVIVYNGSLTTSQRQQVEGYLAWKWGLTSQLAITHPFKNPIVPFSYPLAASKMKQTLFPYFDPRTISGCGLWLDAADTSTLTFQSGSNVSIWTDKVAGIQAQYLTLAMAQARNATALASPNYPVSGYNINGLNALYFNQAILQAIATQNTSTRSYFFVFQCPPGSTGNDFILWPATWVSGFARGASFSLSGTSLLYWSNQNVAYLPVNLNVNALTPTLVSGTFNSGTTAMFNNGGGTTNATGQTSSSFGSSGSSDNYLWIGGAGGLFSSSGFYLGEFLMYNTALSASDRQKIEGYLSWKWKLSSGLPTSHNHLGYPPANPFQLTSPSKIRNTITSQTFTYTGVTQTFIVPGGLTSMLVILWGAGGGTGDQASGGGGAFVQGTLTVVPGETLTIVVGRAGTTSHTYSFYSEQHGFGGVSGNVGAGGGGGFTGIKRGASYIVMAGGGGGAGGGSSTYSGGAGTASGNGFQGGTGGIKSTAANGNNIGGGSASGGTIAGSIGTYQAGGYGGGGGGGYNGGGNSVVGGYIGGGGGGSSLTSNLTSTTLADGAGSTPGNSSSPLRGTAGNGGVPGGQTPGNGLLILRYRP